MTGPMDRRSSAGLPRRLLRAGASPTSRSTTRPGPPTFLELAGRRRRPMPSRTPPAARLTLQPEPVLRWSNPVVGSIQGDVFLWTDEGPARGRGVVLQVVRPVHPPDHEFASLSPGPLVAARDGVRRLGPVAAGVEFRPIPDAPAPADTPAQRLRQIRAMAAEFAAGRPTGRGSTATCGSSRSRSPATRRPGRPRRRGPVRLRPGDRPRGLPDDRGPRASTAAPRWQYALARMNSIAMRATLKGREVWDLPTLADGGDHVRSEPYTSFLFGRLSGSSRPADRRSPMPRSPAGVGPAADNDDRDDPDARRLAARPGGRGRNRRTRLAFMKIGRGLLPVRPRRTRRPAPAPGRPGVPDGQAVGRRRPGRGHLPLAGRASAGPRPRCRSSWSRIQDSPDGNWIHEFISLSPGTFASRPRRQAELVARRARASSSRPVPGAPKPADDARPAAPPDAGPRRGVQGRGRLRRQGMVVELRLLTTPVARYGKAGSAVDDGGPVRLRRGDRPRGLPVHRGPRARRPRVAIRLRPDGVLRPLKVTTRASSSGSIPYDGRRRPVADLSSSGLSTD